MATVLLYLRWWVTSTSSSSWKKWLWCGVRSQSVKVLDSVGQMWKRTLYGRYSLVVENKKRSLMKTILPMHLLCCLSHGSWRWCQHLGCTASPPLFSTWKADVLCCSKCQFLVPRFPELSWRLASSICGGQCVVKWGLHSDSGEEWQTTLPEPDVPNAWSQHVHVNYVSLPFVE